MVAMGAFVKPTPSMLQAELCRRGIHTKKKAVESEIERQFKSGVFAALRMFSLHIARMCMLFVVAMC